MDGELSSPVQPAECTKCLVGHEGVRHYVTYSDTVFTFTRYNAPLFGDRDTRISFSDIVGVQPTFKGFSVLTVDRESDPPSLKSFSFYLSNLHREEPIDEFTKSFRAKVNVKKSDKKLLVLINPFGGTGRAPSIWKNVKFMFNSAELVYEKVETKNIGHARKICGELDLTKYYGVACVSGDGLIWEVVNGLLHRKDGLEAIRAITIGVIPGGSGNGLAASLGAGDPVTAAQYIIKGRHTPLDIFSCFQSGQRHYGFLSVSWGVLGVIDLHSEAYRWLGPLRFDVKGVVEVFSCESYSAKISYVDADPSESSTPSKAQNTSPNALDLKFFANTNSNTSNNSNNSNNTISNLSRSNNGKHEWKTLDGKWSWFLAMNTPKMVNSKHPVSQTISVADGHMELSVAHEMDRVELAQLLLSIEEGTIYSHPKIKHYKVKSFILEPEVGTKAPISLDGERTDNTTVKVEIHPSLARIFCGEKL